MFNTIVAAMFALTTSITATAVAPQATAEVTPEARSLFEQPLTALDDTCEKKDGVSIRHIRFATLDPAGSVEDRLELRTTTLPAATAHKIDYLVNGTLMFTRSSGEELRPTAAGLRLFQTSEGSRVAKILAAFAAVHPRIFAADVEAPGQSCGALEGKAEETAKCGAIGVLGCSSGNALVCGVSAGLALLCSYLVDKTCEENPDSCQPGWTEG